MADVTSRTSLALAAGLAVLAAGAAGFFSSFLGAGLASDSELELELELESSFKFSIRNIVQKAVIQKDMYK